MMILGIDPGPVTCGVVLYSSTTKHVSETHKAMPVSEVLTRLADPEDRWRYYVGMGGAVAIERVQSTGQSGASLLHTSEVVGKIWHQAESRNLRVVLLYRREVCSWLHVHGAGKNSKVRVAMIEMHGGTKEAAVGRKKTPGPLYGVATHAWQALGLAYVAAQMIEQGHGWASKEAAC